MDFDLAFRMSHLDTANSRIDSRKPLGESYGSDRVTLENEFVRQSNGATDAYQTRTKAFDQSLASASLGESQSISVMNGAERGLNDNLACLSENFMHRDRQDRASSGLSNLEAGFRKLNAERMEDNRIQAGQIAGRRLPATPDSAMRTTGDIGGKCLEFQRDREGGFEMTVGRKNAGVMPVNVETPRRSRIPKSISQRMFACFLLINIIFCKHVVKLHNLLLLYLIE